jgi:hypothetical protein
MKYLSSLLLICLLSFGNSLYSQSFDDYPYPFSTNTEQLTIWNGTEYIPFFIKGTNLGIAIPGTYPGELDVSRAQYGRWFQQIKDAGFNVIRLYTLHYPHFYQVLDSFNLANPENPLFIIQGVWLNEETEGYNNDLRMLDEQFELEIRDNIDCIHGNNDIPHRYGKAWGVFDTDVSKWCMSYLIGREINHNEILKTNEVMSNQTSFEGEHFAIHDALGAEVWYTDKLNQTAAYEYNNYGTMRPVSFSSWPTLDPLKHPEEIFQDEDTAWVDLSKVEKRFAPAGFYISYHAYPYYPDFISNQSDYLQFYDNYGPNSYLGYLTDLKSHYPQYPLIIAEFGVPSSWGIAHYASSGMNHGGVDQKTQGEMGIRMLHTMRDAGCGGGIQFAWMDEWFKRTWVTDHIDFPAARRILWQNATAAEQNFGLIAFEKESEMTNIGYFGSNSDIQYISAGSNYEYFEVEIGLKNSLEIPDELWVAFDTYWNETGESILPTGSQLSHRSEFALEIKNYSADLYVTEAYDLYGIYHYVSSPQQMYRSTITDGAPWVIVRWKNNEVENAVQYIGHLQLNHATQAPSSMDAVTIYDDKIKIKLPFTLLNFISPSDLSVFHDNRDTWGVTEEATSDGIAVSVDYKGNVYSSQSRHTWQPWGVEDVRLDSDLQEVFKTSYWVMKDNLSLFNSDAIAVVDSFYVEGPSFPVNINESEGVLMNDFDLDGSTLLALLTEPPLHGSVSLYNDGSFQYNPDKGFNGYDSYQYCVFDGNSLSEQNQVVIKVSNNPAGIANLHKDDASIKIYPNPVSNMLYIDAEEDIQYAKLFNLSGQLVLEQNQQNSRVLMNVNTLASGEYILLLQFEDHAASKKVLIRN